MIIITNVVIEFFFLSKKNDIFILIMAEHFTHYATKNNCWLFHHISGYFHYGFTFIKLRIRRSFFSGFYTGRQVWKIHIQIWDQVCFKNCCAKCTYVKEKNVSICFRKQRHFINIGVGIGGSILIWKYTEKQRLHGCFYQPLFCEYIAFWDNTDCLRKIDHIGFINLRHPNMSSCLWFIRWR